MKQASYPRTDRLIEPKHWFVVAAFLAAGLYIFIPLRSPLAAEPKVASQTLGTPAPQSDQTPTNESGAPVGAGAMAAGVATLAAARRK